MRVEIHFYGGNIMTGLVDKQQLQNFRNSKVNGLYVKRLGEKDIIIPNENILIIKEVAN